MSEIAVFLPVHPKWCFHISTGEKEIEIRKTVPVLKPPFRCCLYCTKGPYALLAPRLLGNKESEDLLDVEKGWQGRIEAPESLNGMVIGEFICDEIIRYGAPESLDKERLEQIARQAILNVEDLYAYAKHKNLYGWHISQFVRYDTPKKLNEFVSATETKNGTAVERKTLSRPPQSWCYIEEG